MKSTTKGKVLTAALLALVTLCAVILSACDTGSGDSDFLASIPDLGESVDTSVSDESSDESTPEGYTAKPKVGTIVNVSPSKVVIAGTCEDGAVINIKGGKEEITVASKDGYFITTTVLTGTSQTLLEITAKVEGKEESEILSAVAYYSAISEPRADGMSVAVGKDSHLYFDKMIENYTGANLLTQTELRQFKTFVNSKVSACVSRANGSDFDLIYVLIPDVTSIYDEYLDDDIKRETHQTRYEQISAALAETEAIVIDMYDAFMAAKENSEYPIYRTTDSHLTEYGAYLVNVEICKVMAERFPAAAAHPLEEYEITTKNVIGGDLVSYLGISKNITNEDVPVLKPKYDISIGDGESKGFDTTKISDLKIYTSSTDYSINEGKDPGAVLARTYFRTENTELPCALVYRDDSAATLTPFLAERLCNSMFALSGDFTINLTDAGRHNGEGRSLVDYVIVTVGESNLNKILG